LRRLRMMLRLPKPEGSIQSVSTYTHKGY
jgi:hypothetical protein